MLFMVQHGGQRLLPESVAQLHTIVSFAGGGQRRRLFRGLVILTIKWATGDLLEECRFLLHTQLMFLKKEKDPTSKQLDDDEWIRSLTEAQEITADASEDSVMCDQQEVDPKKSACQNESRREKLHWNDRVEGSARGGVAVSIQAHSSSGVDTSKPVSQKEVPPMPKDRAWCRERRC